MKLYRNSLAGIDSTPDPWEIDFVNKKFIFKNDEKHNVFYRSSSYLIEATLLFIISFLLYFYLLYFLYFILLSLFILVF